MWRDVQAVHMLIVSRIRSGDVSVVSVAPTASLQSDPSSSSTSTPSSATDSPEREALWLPSSLPATCRTPSLLPHGLLAN